MDDVLKARVAELLRTGASLSAAARALGVTPHRLRSARRAEPGFDAVLTAAARAGGRPQQVAPLRPLRCPGDCGARGYAHGCRLDPCREVHQTALARRPRGERKPNHRFGREAEYLEQLRAGWTVHEAAERIGCEYTAVYYRRLTDPEFDAAVVEAAVVGTPDGRPGPRPRPVHRLRGDTR